MYAFLINICIFRESRTGKVLSNFLEISVYAFSECANLFGRHVLGCGPTGLTHSPSSGRDTVDLLRASGSTLGTRRLDAATFRLTHFYHMLTFRSKYFLTESTFRLTRLWLQTRNLYLQKVKAGVDTVTLVGLRHRRCPQGQQVDTRHPPG